MSLFFYYRGFRILTPLSLSALVITFLVSLYLISSHSIELQERRVIKNLSGAKSMWPGLNCPSDWNMINACGCTNCLYLGTNNRVRPNRFRRP